MKCYRESTCRVRLHGERACLHRFAVDHCPNSQLGKDEDDEMQFPPTRDVRVEESNGLYSDGEQ